MSTLLILLPLAWAAADTPQPIELLVRGDDMGHSLDINQAFIKAHTEGILTSASLMASAAYFDDAEERSQQQGDPI